MLECKYSEMGRFDCFGSFSVDDSSKDSNNKGGKNRGMFTVSRGNGKSMVTEGCDDNPTYDICNNG